MTSSLSFFLLVKSSISFLFQLLLFFGYMVDISFFPYSRPPHVLWGVDKKLPNATVKGNTSDNGIQENEQSSSILKKECKAQHYKQRIPPFYVSCACSRCVYTLYDIANCFPVQRYRWPLSYETNNKTLLYLHMKPSQLSIIVKLTSQHSHNLLVVGSNRDSNDLNEVRSKFKTISSQFRSNSILARCRYEITSIFRRLTDV